jgi:hypothetical protein
MCQNDFCGHPPKHKTHRRTEKNKSVLFQKRRMRRVQPETTREREYDYWRPLKENWENWEILASAGCDHIENTGGSVSGGD